MIKPFVVFGNPVEQSQSPFIHRQFAEQFGKQLDYHIDYQKQWVAVNGFYHAADNFFQNGGIGANVTAPFKLDAFNYVSQLSPRAELARAVNTLTRRDNIICGDNTDGIGWMRDICNNQQQTLTHKHILLWGAGGAAQGLMDAVIQQQPSRLTIINRTFKRADLLVKAFKSSALSRRVDLKALSMESIEGINPDFIINASSVGLNCTNVIDLPKSLAKSKPYCYDLTYSSSDTVFVQWAKNLELESSDGLGMLVEQAAESFFIWHNLRPETQSVIKQLRQHLNNI